MMFFMTGMNDIWHALEVPCDPAGLDGALENVRNWFPDDDQFGDCLRNEKRASCDPRLGTELQLGLLHYACGSALAPGSGDEQERRAACVARLLAVGAGFVDGAATHVTRTEDGFASRGGLTPLHVWASTLGEHSLPVLRQLVDAGADAGLRDAGGDAPLHTFAYAASFADEAACDARLDLLLRAGADLSAVDAKGRTPLACARLVAEDAPSAVVAVLERRTAAARAAALAAGEAALAAVEATAAAEGDETAWGGFSS